MTKTTNTMDHGGCRRRRAAAAAAAAAFCFCRHGLLWPVKP